MHDTMTWQDDMTDWHDMMTYDGMRWEGGAAEPIREILDWNSNAIYNDIQNVKNHQDPVLGALEIYNHQVKILRENGYKGKTKISIWLQYNHILVGIS